MMSVFRSFELFLTSDIGMFRRCKERRFPCLYAGTLALDHLADKTERASSEPYGRLTGRLKDMIIRGGENIYPKEIEEFIYTYDKVKDVQVIGVPDEALGEEILAAVVPKEGETITEEEIKAITNMNNDKLQAKVNEIIKAFVNSDAYSELIVKWFD